MSAQGVFRSPRDIVWSRGTFSHLPIVDKLAGFFKKISEHKQVIESLQKMGDEFHYLGPDDFAKYWRKDYQVYKDMAKMFGK
jgi:tripartite-type tricarboxylate transporter receptor subunit TctC